MSHKSVERARQQFWREDAVDISTNDILSVPARGLSKYTLTMIAPLTAHELFLRFMKCFLDKYARS